MEKNPIITGKKVFNLLGCVFYGNPFHSAPPWSINNEIGRTWMRFFDLYKKYETFIEKIRIGPRTAYEIHIEAGDYTKTKEFNIFIGFEVKIFEFVPLEMFIKILPNTEYAVVTSDAIEFTECDVFFRKWLPNSEYEQSFPYIIEGYEEGRYNYEDLENSELDWYIPVKKKEKNSN
jgi:AraC family transcriptional regulator